MFLELFFLKVNKNLDKTFCQDFSEDDRIFILTTKMAMKNWNDGEHENFRTKKKEFHTGLKKKLTELDMLCEIKNIHVNNLINVSNFTKGTYFIKIVSKQNTITKKLIIK